MSQRLVLAAVIAHVCSTNRDRQLSFFYDDYEIACLDALTFDEKVKTDSIAAGGQDYLSLTSLAARQAFAAIEYTNTPTEPWLFMKEISSDGNVNTADGESVNARSRCQFLYARRRLVQLV